MELTHIKNFIIATFIAFAYYFMSSMLPEYVIDEYSYVNRFLLNLKQLTSTQEHSDLIKIVEPSRNHQNYAMELSELASFQPKVVVIDFPLLLSKERYEIADISDSLNIPFIVGYERTDPARHIASIDSVIAVHSTWTKGYLDVEDKGIIYPKDEITNSQHLSLAVSKVFGTNYEKSHPNKIYIHLKNTLNEYEVLTFDDLYRNISLVKNKIVLYGDIYYGQKFYLVPKVGRTPRILVNVNLMESLINNDFIVMNNLVGSICLFFLTFLSFSFVRLSNFLYIPSLLVLLPVLILYFNILVHPESLIFCLFFSGLLKRYVFRQKLMEI